MEDFSAFDSKPQEDFSAFDSPAEPAAQAAPPEPESKLGKFFRSAAGTVPGAASVQAYAPGLSKAVGLLPENAGPASTAEKIAAPIGDLGNAALLGAGIATGGVGPALKGGVKFAAAMGGMDAAGLNEKLSKLSEETFTKAHQEQILDLLAKENAERAKKHLHPVTLDSGAFVDPVGIGLESLVEAIPSYLAGKAASHSVRADVGRAAEAGKTALTPADLPGREVVSNALIKVLGKDPTMTPKEAGYPEVTKEEIDSMRRARAGGMARPEMQSLGETADAPPQPVPVPGITDMEGKPLLAMEGPVQVPGEAPAGPGSSLEGLIRGEQAPEASAQAPEPAAQPQEGLREGTDGRTLGDEGPPVSDAEPGGAPPASNPPANPPEEQAVDLFGDPIKSPEPLALSQAGDVMSVPVSEIKVDPQEFQFKSGHDKGGVVDPLKGDFNKHLAGNLLLWENTDGDLYVVNGHHRFGKALETGAKDVNAQIIHESEGYSKADARALGAEINIAEGKGTIHDQARFFRHSIEGGRKFEEAEIQRKGLQGAGWRIGSGASGDLYALFQDGEYKGAQAISPQQTEAIIDAAGPGNDGLQRVGLAAWTADKKIDPDVLRKLVQRYGTSKLAGDIPAQVDMFGKGSQYAGALKQMKLEAETASRMQRELQEANTAVKGAAKRPEKAAAGGVVVADVGKTLKAVAEREAMIEGWKHWATNPDLVALVQSEIAAKKPGFTGAVGSGAGLFGGHVAQSYWDLAVRKLKAMAKGHLSVSDYAEERSRITDRNIFEKAEAIKKGGATAQELMKLPASSGDMNGIKIVKRFLDPTAVIPRLAEEAGNLTDDFHGTKAQFFDMASKIYKDARLTREEGQMVAMALDAHASLVDQRLEGARKLFRTLLDRLAVLEGLPPGLTLEEYWPHIMDYETAKKFKETGMLEVPDDGVKLKPLIKPTVNVHHQHRFKDFTNEPKYSYDLLPVLEARISVGLKKAFFNPFVDHYTKAGRAGFDELSGLDKWTKKYADNYLMQLQGRPMRWQELMDQAFGHFGQQPGTSTRIQRNISRAYYRSLLGLAWDTAFKNLFQSGNTYTETGAKNTALGIYKIFTREGRKQFEAAKVLDNYAKGMEGHAELLSASRFMKNVDALLFTPMRFSEYYNRGIAFHAGVADGLARGIRDGGELNRYAKHVVDKTQFRYGIANTSPYMNNALSKLAYQFSTYPMKELQFIRETMKSPEKAKMARLLAFHGFLLASTAATGVNLMNAIGWEKAGDAALVGGYVPKVLKNVPLPTQYLSTLVGARSPTVKLLAGALSGPKGKLVYGDPGQNLGYLAAGQVGLPLRSLNKAATLYDELTGPGLEREKNPTLLQLLSGDTKPYSAPVSPGRSLAKFIGY